MVLTVYGALRGDRLCPRHGLDDRTSLPGWARATPVELGTSIGVSGPRALTVRNTAARLRASVDRSRIAPPCDLSIMTMASSTTKPTEIASATAHDHFDLRHTRHRRVRIPIRNWRPTKRPHLERWQYAGLRMGFKAQSTTRSITTVSIGASGCQGRTNFAVI